MRISDGSSDGGSADLLQAAVLEEPGQPVPVAQRVADVGGQRGPGGDHRQLLLEPGFQGRDDRRRIFFASGKPSLWRRAGHCRLDRVERGDLTDGVFGDGRLRVSRLFDEAPAQMAPAMHERPWSLRPLDAGEPIIAVIAVALQELSSKALQEEHTSELQSLMRISYAVFCL